MSLVDINPLPTAGNAAILLHPDDNVAIARVPLSPGQALEFGGRRVECRDQVPAGHKVALCPIRSGDWLVRYGQRIGRSSRAIASGEHVHVHNVSFEEIAFDYEFPESDTEAQASGGEMPTFLGYPREDGRAGTRNYIAVVAASNCAAHTAELIASSYKAGALPENVDGVVAFPHGEGCGHAFGPDT
ncbi:MAG: UxaA family hydrolase, partial [Acidobacteria bacterium]|nr:UxaA family hydrolase [Acidobacteriota bacterium]